MGVDFYHCERCDECLHYDRFPRCLMCETTEYCEYCVDEELCIFDDKNENFEVICHKCIKDRSIDDIIDNLENERMNLSKDKMIKIINEMKQNIPTEQLLIERELAKVEREIKLLTKQKKELLKKLKNI